MNRRHGMEGEYGIGGGGVVSKESERNLNIARDLCRRGKPNEAVPYLSIALKDRNNLDAMIEMAFICPTMAQSVETLERAESRGRVMLQARLGSNCFDDDGGSVGHFWDILETRPYMRVLQALERIYFEAKLYPKATTSMIELLRLCPGDNMSVRKNLGTALNRDKRYADALCFAQQWLKPGRKETPLRGGTQFSEPNPNPYTEEEEKTLTSWCCGELIHTAALASFKLYSDCPQSQQYIRIATKINPHILLKILARKSKPEHLNPNPRVMNGLEDAHDYLWYSQELWMESDVWEWANSNHDARQVILKRCSRDGCSSKEGEVAQFKRCAACHLVSYCGQECQKLDWKSHKPACKESQVLKSAIRAFNAGKPVEKDAPFMFAPDFNSNGVVVSEAKRKT